MPTESHSKSLEMQRFVENARSLLRSQEDKRAERERRRSYLAISSSIPHVIGWPVTLSLVIGACSAYFYVYSDSVHAVNLINDSLAKYLRF